MKRILFVIVLLSFFQSTGLKAVEFSAKEKSIIYTGAIGVLENYQAIMNRMGEYVVNDVEKAKSDAESFLELFVNRQVLIYNDLDPTHKQLSQFYEAESYSNNLLLWYPDGITISLDITNAKVGEIMSHEENIYSIDLLVKKSINGNYFNQAINKNIEELTFRIAFSMESKTPTNFKIVGIREANSSAVVDYTQALREVNSEDLSKEDIAKVQTELKAILHDYSNYLQLLGDPQESAEDKESYKTSFIKLFEKTDAKVYNDIAPNPQTSLISASDYLNAYIADYPGGIKNFSLNPDSAKFGQVMKTEEGSYYTYVEAAKFFSGSYKGKDVFRDMFQLKFKFIFSAEGKTFTRFLIAGVDKTSADFYQAAPGSAEKKPEFIIQPVTRKGIVVSVSASFGLTKIKNENLSSMSVETNLHSWTESPLSGYIGGIGLSYFFNDNMAAKTGLEFNKISTEFNLSGKFTDNAFSTDLNAEKFYKIIEANYDSIVVINYLTLPFLFNYTSGKPGKLGFYGEGGFKVSIPLNSSYSNTGDYKYSGYYPSHPAVFQLLTDSEVPELGFYTRENIDDTDKAGIKGINLAFYVSAGINIPLGFYSSITIGPEIAIGLTDILKNKGKYEDIFGKEYTSEPTKIRNFGLRISFAYKL